jgi:RHS repeat-associated protein
LGWKNNSELRQVFLDRYDSTNLFNFKQRELYTPNVFMQPTKSYIYDSASQEWNFQSVSGRSAAGKLDDQERPVLIQSGEVLPVQISYNNFGKVARVQQGDRVSTFAYDARGFLTSVTDPLARQHRFTNDVIGRQTQAIAPSGDTVDFLYDKNSNLTGIHPFGKDWHQLVYNIVDLFSVYQPPAVGAASSAKSYIYNTSRDLQKVTRPDGKEIVYGYDASKARLTSVGMGAQGIGFAYQDFAGNITRFNNLENGAVTQISYVGDRPSNWNESQLRMPNNVQLTSFVDFTWDIYGNIASIAHTTTSGVRNTVAYTYDVDDLMLTAGAMQITRAATDSFVKGTTLGNVTDAYTYSNYGELASYQSPVYSYTLQRDALGRIVQKVENSAEGAVTFGYTYDANDRLSVVSKNGVPTSQYSYDGNGNRVSKVEGGQTISATFDSQDRVVQSGSVQYQFNAEGELQQKTDGTKITKYDYGLFGQLRSVQLPSGSTITYDINGLGLRIGKRVDGVFKTFYQWQSGTQLAAEVGPSGVVQARFVYGVQGHSPDYMIKNGVSYRFIKDHLGSIRVVVNTNDGSIVQKFDYDEWGKVLTDTNPGFQPFGYAGGLYDGDTGLVRFGARDYDADTGRWTNKDPLIFDGGQSNLYAYAESEPINRIDPDGRIWIQVAAGLAGGAWNAYQNYSAASAVVGVTTKQLIASSALGFATGALSGFTATFGIGAGVLGNAGAAALNNAGNQRIFGSGACSINMSSVREAALLGGASGLVSGALGQGIGGAIGLTQLGQNVFGLPLGILGLNVTNGIPAH